MGARIADSALYGHLWGPTSSGACSRRRPGSATAEAVARSDELRLHARSCARPSSLDTGAAGAMVDDVVERARRARAAEPDRWA